MYIKHGKNNKLSGLKFQYLNPLVNLEKTDEGEKEKEKTEQTIQRAKYWRGG